MAELGTKVEPVAAHATPHSSARRRSSAHGSGIRLSHEHLVLLRPDLGMTTPAEKLASAGVFQWCAFLCCAPTSDTGLAVEDPQTAEIRNILSAGQSLPAYVVQVEPLVIGVYCDVLDAAVLLRYPAQISVSLVHGFHLQPRSRLLAIATLSPKLREADEMEADIEPGLVANERAIQTYAGFRPEIVNFISTDEVRILDCQNEIDEQIWSRARVVIDERASVDDIIYRDGLPGRTFAPRRA
ncbi:Hypothetical Protein FCC1311_010042 [Hondaea fermentalgiana]|uniref:Uncharacterized protein n=1 Tax=Hondaea fermentalgiana TaxID=2315210 RepID=A0A2R5G184_9STRA|nr:Hypothetical Protein FCC1311_010042 [Hondaea fermentalgiana]|eukprot:GBG24786.1 Hypothetical Protein FCC1311_010042 [Hondaea fermentalgiana]